MSNDKCQNPNMSNDKCQNPSCNPNLSNDRFPNPMFTDNGEFSLFSAFQDLCLGSNKNIIDQRGSSNSGDKNSLNVNYNSIPCFLETQSMSNDKSKNPLFTDNGENPVFTAFQTLSFGRNNNTIDQIGTSNRCDNNNLNVHYNNYGPLSLQGYPSLKASPSWISKPGFASSSTNSFQPMAFSPQSYVNYGMNLDGDLSDMMKRPSGSEEFKGLLETCNTFPTAERERCLKNIGSVVTGNQFTFLSLARDQNGSHALRKLLKRTPRLDELVFNAVCINFYSLMNSKYGHYLIIATIKAVDKPLKEKLYEKTRDNALFLAREENGCIALNCVLEEVKGTHRDEILEIIAYNVDWLSFDPYGTHVVQNILTLQNPDATRVICQKLCGSFFRLATRQHGSYVVEKCLKTKFGYEKVLEEFRGNDIEWVRLAKNTFGNFVAQCALKVMKQNGLIQMLREFVDKLRPHFGDMKIGPGKNTLNYIEKEIEEWY